MTREVQVLDADGALLLPTYEKRARQLVKNGRAQWVNENAIRLYKEENLMDMDYTSNDGARHYTEAVPVKKRVYMEEEPVLRTYSDEDLYKIARNRVRARSALAIHTIVYIMVNMLIVVVTDSPVVMMAWGIGLAVHYGTYFFAATPQSIEKEYLKLRRKYK